MKSNLSRLLINLAIITYIVTCYAYATTLDDAIVKHEDNICGQLTQIESDDMQYPVFRISELYRVRDYIIDYVKSNWAGSETECPVTSSIHYIGVCRLRNRVVVSLNKRTECNKAYSLEYLIALFKDTVIDHPALYFNNLRFYHDHYYAGKPSFMSDEQHGGVFLNGAFYGLSIVLMATLCFVFKYTMSKSSKQD